jgi:hypothetical protein
VAKTDTKIAKTSLVPMGKLAFLPRNRVEKGSKTNARLWVEEVPVKVPVNR